MTWQAKLTHLTAQIAAKTAARDELTSLIGGDTASIWQPRRDSLASRIVQLTAQRDGLASLFTAATGSEQLATDLATRTTERDAALSQVTGLTGALETRTSERDAAINTINDLNGVISERDATILQHLATIAARDGTIVERDATIADLLAQLQPLTFKIFNEYRSAPSMPNMPQIRLVNESEMIAPGDVDSDPPVPSFIDDVFGAIKAAGHNWIVSDNEAWAAPTNGVITTANMANFIVLGERAALAGLQYSQYQYPYRTTGFLTGSGDINVPGTENYNRLQTFRSNVAGTQELTDLMTGGLTPNFYYMPAVQTNVTKLRQWIDIYVDLWQTVAPTKKMIPLVWPRWQNDGSVWIAGPTYRITLDKIKERCSSMILFGRSGDADPDPRDEVPVPDWWIEHEDFTAEWGLTA